MKSQEEEVPEVVKAGKEVPACAWHQHTGWEGVLVDGVAPEQEEAEHVREDCVHATFIERSLGFVNTEHLHLSVIVVIFVVNWLLYLYLAL